MNTVKDRPAILAEILELESRLVELRKLLPSPVKAFYRFRCKPEKFVWVYADSRETAEMKLRGRMNKHYATSWEIVSTVVDVYEDPHKVAATTPGNLLHSLTESDAAEFVKDFRDNQTGRATNPDKNLPKSRLLLDIESWELGQRLRSA